MVLTAKSQNYRQRVFRIVVPGGEEEERVTKLTDLAMQNVDPEYMRKEYRNMTNVKDLTMCPRPPQKKPPHM